MFSGLGRSILTPYGEGGVASQRWYDFSAEAIALRRDNGAGNFIFSTLGRGPVTATNVALGSDATDFDEYEVGLGLQGNIQVGPGSNVEAVYFGLNEWEESATATSTAPNLFSFFSDFGNDPFNGFDDPDRSFVHRINYKSRINNGEVNFRRRWAEPSGFLQGSWLAGIRYFHLSELMSFQASVNSTTRSTPMVFDSSITRPRLAINLPVFRSAAICG